MAAPANDAQTPVYGDKGAKLRNFHQKHRPPQTFVELRPIRLRRPATQWPPSRGKVPRNKARTTCPRRHSQRLCHRVRTGRCRLPHHRDARTQHTPALPQTIVNVNAYPPKQSSYSELSHALELPTTNEGAHLTTQDFAASPRIVIPPKVNVDFYALSSSTGPGAGFAALAPLALPYAQDIITKKAVSDRSTHLWSQSGYTPPQYPVNNLHYPSTTLPSKMVGSTCSLTHIDSQWSVDRHGFRLAM